jgi:amino acid transporter
VRVVGVLVVALVLAGLAAAALRGVRRSAWPHEGVEDAGRSATQAVVEGLIVLAVVILGVVVVVAFLD